MPKYKFVGIDGHSKTRFVREYEAKNLEVAKARGLQEYKQEHKHNPAEVRVERRG
jgi:hypothetical protein